jgi:ribosomal protein S18 acetylase RimI-like enzyme
MAVYRELARTSASFGVKPGMHDSLLQMEIYVREARPADVDFARALYFQTMRGMIDPLFGWDQRRQEESFAGWFHVEEAAIIVADGREVGWLQTRTNEREVFLASHYLRPDMQRRGIGTYILRKLIADSAQRSKTVTLAVMKINPAVRLYQRLGFRVTHEDLYKFYMRSDGRAFQGTDRSAHSLDPR